jgi:cation transport ATPase
VADARRRARALLALIAFGDTVKPGARDAIAALSARGVASVLVTGDNRGSAAPSRRRSGSMKCMRRCCPTTRRAWSPS